MTSRRMHVFWLRCRFSCSREIPIGKRLRQVTRHFLNAGLIRKAEQKQFASYVVDTVRFQPIATRRNDPACSVVYFCLRRVVTDLVARRQHLVLALAGEKPFAGRLLLRLGKPCQSFNSSHFAGHFAWSYGPGCYGRSRASTCYSLPPTLMAQAV